MMTRKEQIAFLTAIESGARAQWRYQGLETWKDCSAGYPIAPDFSHYEYRIKPEPRVIYVNEYGSGRFGAHVSSESAERSALDPIRTAVRYVESPE